MKKAFLLMVLMAATAAVLCSPGWAVDDPPGVVVLGSIQEKFGPVSFDHEMHTYIASYCARCHHQHINTQDMDCLNCHSVQPEVLKTHVTDSFIACKNCHGEFDMENPGMPGLKQAYHQTCLGCHAEKKGEPQSCAVVCHVNNPPGDIPPGQ